MPDVQVKMQRGGLGELRVEVDGQDAYDGSRLWYPRPSTVLGKVRGRLAAQPSA